MKSLENYCIKHVCNHLEYNYKVCIHKNWRIGLRISDKLYNYAIKYNKPLSDNEMKFFHQNITTLSEFSVRYRSLNIKSFDFLNGYHFEKLSLIFIQNLNFENNLNFKIFTKKFNLKRIDDENNCIKSLQKLLSNYLEVEESIRIKEIENNSIINSICDLIRKSSSKSLFKKFSMDKCELNSKNVENLSNELLNLTCLEKFKIKDCKFLEIEENGNILLSSIENSLKTLKTFSIERLAFNFSTLRSLIEKMDNLEKLVIDFRENNEKTNNLNNFFQHLKIKEFRNLKSVKFLNVNMNSNVEINIAKFFQPYKNLEKIVIKRIGGGHFDNKKIFYSTVNNWKTLKSFNIERLYSIDIQEEVEKSLINFHNLKKITLFSKMHFFEFPSRYVEKMINNSKFTLNEIKVYAELDESTLDVIENIDCLQNLTCKSLNGINNLDKFINLFKIHRENLKKIDILHKSLLDVFYINEILGLISKCPNISTLNLDVSHGNLKILDLLNFSCAFLENIKILTIHPRISEADIEQSGNVLMKCKNLRRLKLYYVVGTVSIIKTFLNNIKTMFLSLEELKLQGRFAHDIHGSLYEAQSFSISLRNFESVYDVLENICEADDDCLDAYKFNDLF